MAEVVSGLVFAFWAQGFVAEARAGALVLQPMVQYPFTGESEPIALALGDVNRDGKLDLIAGMGGKISVLLGKGDGTFRSHVDYPLPAPPYAGIAAVDLNSDGKLDLTAGADTYLSVFRGNGIGTFSPAVNWQADQNPGMWVVSDVNGDGKADLIDGQSGIYDPGSVGVRLGYGDGTFQPSVNYPIDHYPAGIVVGDLNIDGKPDLIAIQQGDKGDPPHIGIINLWC
jgi:hypothetical protein